MQSRRKHILSSISYVLGAQMLLMAIGIIRALILPAFFPVMSYGYWEVYLFYTSYVGLFCLGFNDGIYLRYGEYDYDQMPFRVLRPASRLYLAQLTLFSLCALISVNLFVEDPNTRYSMSFASLNIIIMGAYGVMIHLLQITDQFKRYSFFTVIDKLFVLFTICIMFFANNTNFKVIVCIDFLSKMAIVFIMMRMCRELWFGKTEVSLKTALGEYKNNVLVGISLMIAHLMSMLLVGAGRMIVQFWGGIEDFAVYSFGVTVTGLVLTAISAFSLVLYPIIKRLPFDNYSIYFNKINVFTRTFGMGSLLAFFPAFWLVLLLYPKYADVLTYLHLLFGVVFLQGKISILNNTFYKALREEKSMLKANMSCLLIFVILAIPGFWFFQKVEIIALCTFIAMFIRCYASELFLMKKLHIPFSQKTLREVCYLLAFIVSTSFFDIFVSMCITLIMCMIYVISEWKDIYSTAITLLKEKK